MNYEKVAFWRINHKCNLDCEYCFLEDRKTPDRYIDVNRTVDTFDRTGYKWLVCLSGGEPFLHKDFIKLCSKLTKEHFIGIDSNLTINVDEFIKQVNPNKVEFIDASLHFGERESLDKFIVNVKKLRDNGFPVFIKQVMYPPLIKKFNAIHGYIKSQGLDVLCTSFLGSFNGKQYPEAYTKKERAMIKGSKMFSDVWSPPLHANFIRAIKKLSYGNLSWKGKPCSAGVGMVRITPQGNVYRCDSDSNYLGNVEVSIKLGKVQNCRVPCCTCPLEGLVFGLDEGEYIETNK